MSCLRCSPRTQTLSGQRANSWRSADPEAPLPTPFARSANDTRSRLTPRAFPACWSGLGGSGWVCGGWGSNGSRTFSGTSLALPSRKTVGLVLRLSGRPAFILGVASIPCTAAQFGCALCRHTPNPSFPRASLALADATDKRIDATEEVGLRGHGAASRQNRIRVDANLRKHCPAALHPVIGAERQLGGAESLRVFVAQSAVRESEW